jgi:hypothetical protein
MFGGGGQGTNVQSNSAYPGVVYVLSLRLPMTPMSMNENIAPGPVERATPSDGEPPCGRTNNSQTWGHRVANELGCRKPRC